MVTYYVQKVNQCISKVKLMEYGIYCCSSKQFCLGKDLYYNRSDVTFKLNFKKASFLFEGHLTKLKATQLDV